MKIRIAVAALAALGLAACGGPAPEAGPGSGPATTPGTQAPTESKTLTVVTHEGRLIGVITDVLPTGANDVYAIRPAEGVNGGRELLLPAIADVIESVDLQERRMVVRLLEGLIEE